MSGIPPPFPDRRRVREPDEEARREVRELFKLLTLSELESQSQAMDEEDDDDIYAPDEDIGVKNSRYANEGSGIINDSKNGGDEEEEGEEIEEDGSDSDIDIIVERKGEPQAASLHPSQGRDVDGKLSARPATIETPPVTATTSTQSVKPEPGVRDASQKPGSSYPAIKSSEINVDAKPIYDPTGKPITDVDLDADFAEDDKPWRRPGTDMSDYFNYGFDEFTWASYCLKQDTLRKEVTDSKKQMEEMQSFLGGNMGSMPGISGAPTAGASQAMPTMGAPGDIPPEMQQMMQQMMASGMDPMQMDPAQFMQMMQGGGQGGQMGGPGQGFGGQGFGQQTPNQQQMNYGYGSGGSGSGGGGPGPSSGRNQGGRGQGRRW